MQTVKLKKRGVFGVRVISFSFRQVKTKIVYIIVSNPSDYYLEQALISVYSLRMHNTDAIIELVVDKDTSDTLIGKRGKIKEYVTSTNVINVSTEYDKKSRSRYIKTNLRKFIKGDYLYIDCDTVICGKLNQIDSINYDLAAVADINGDLPLTDKSVLVRCEEAGFSELTHQPYFNSGVMLVKDTDETQKFYQRWFTNWERSRSKGIIFDQPALCQTNVEMSYPIKELSGIWNCQFKYQQGYGYLKDALIMHYFNPNGTNHWTYPSDCLFKSVKEKGYLDATIKNLLGKPTTLLYTVMTINKESSYRFFNSEMVDVYFNNPTLFRFLIRLSHLLYKSFLAFSKLKSNLKK